MAAPSGGLRRAFLDRSPGEVRGLVALDGRAERLLIAREGDRTARVGQRFTARVEAVSGRLGLARLDLGGAPGALRIKGANAPAVGARLVVDVTAEPSRGKPAAVRRLDEDAAGRVPGPLSPPPTVEAQLQALGFEDWSEGEDAREALEEAEAEALARDHDLGQGVALAIEPTRALTAVDVDLAETGSPVSVARANALALGAAARLLRLKSLGGLVAIDLIGFPPDGARIVELAREAFAADGEGVAIARPSRFGVLELSRPHGRQPLHERLLEADGRATAQTAALRLVRALHRQGRFDPGARLVAVCAPDVAAEAAPLVARLGPRFAVRAQLGAARDAHDIRTQ